MYQQLRLIFAILVISVCHTNTEAYRILSINSSPSRSHVIVQEALAKELARRGHHVTMVSPYPSASSLENYREITVPIVKPCAGAMASMMKDQSGWAMFMTMLSISDVFMDAMNNSINHPEVRRVIRKEKFDLIITPVIADFVLGLTQLLDAPAITVCPNSIFGYLNGVVGNPNPIATIPSPMVGLTSPMKFFDRVTNIFGWLLETFFAKYLKYTSEKFYYSNFPADQFHPYDDARKNISLLLVNQHFSKAGPRPYVPAVVEVGGLQTKSKPDPLPKDLQDWMDGAEHGVILFSLGSNIQSSSIPGEKLDAVINTLKKLKQRVIWKWDSPDLPNKPSNVLLRPWLPQDDILAHKNIRLFVTHGGLGGVAEAQFHGVPLVGIPFFGDQPGNLLNVQRAGWAVVVEFTELTEQTFTAAIKELLENSSYTDTARKLSKLYRDRPMTAMDTAVYWTEYVIRNKGAHHMRYSGVDLNFFQLHLLDVWAVLGSVVFLFVVIIIRVCKFCCRSCCPTNTGLSSGKKNRKVKSH
ncbi:UDP-glucosyltransferase 2-like [Sabethes cyaneus]|uniref:UDP-glucosyltransferase 2-like n=1 Tax=Sabethes cyaneus TaxID=53552 RepID=UPI00237E2512|nr:UDP-glucosyltransferase 2-like [Sabethes cyaneus]